jgi:hypothetical protein
MPNWKGHRPATSAVLVDLLTTAHTGGVRFSRSERVLFTACEFWAAARNRALAGLLCDDADGQLYAAEQAFKTIGLNKAALVLRSGHMKLTEIDRPLPLQRVAAAIENALAAIDEPVDEVIANYATEQALERFIHL